MSSILGAFSSAFQRVASRETHTMPIDPHQTANSNTWANTTTKITIYSVSFFACIASLYCLPFVPALMIDAGIIYLVYIALNNRNDLTKSHAYSTDFSIPSRPSRFATFGTPRYSNMGERRHTTDVRNVLLNDRKSCGEDDITGDTKSTPPAAYRRFDLEDDTNGISGLITTTTDVPGLIRTRTPISYSSSSQVGRKKKRSNRVVSTSLHLPPVSPNAYIHGLPPSSGSQLGGRDEGRGHVPTSLPLPLMPSITTTLSPWTSSFSFPTRTVTHVSPTSSPSTSTRASVLGGGLGRGGVPTSFSSSAPFTPPSGPNVLNSRSVR